MCTRVNAPRATRIKARQKKETFHSTHVLLPQIKISELNYVYLYFKDDVYELLLKFIPVRFFHSSEKLYYWLMREKITLKSYITINLFCLDI
jgi:hypothetical protein